LITVTYTVLLNITGELRPRSFLFRSHTKAIQRKMCCQKVRCILIIVISLIITVVILVILCKYKNKIKKIKYHIVEHTTQHRELKLEARTKTGDEERKKISHVCNVLCVLRVIFFSFLHLRFFSFLLILVHCIVLCVLHVIFFSFLHLRFFSLLLILEERKKTGGEERKKISHVEHIIHYKELKLEVTILICSCLPMINCF
jgi:hypothetical protein